jgi:hypothetical protein
LLLYWGIRALKLAFFKKRAAETLGKTIKQALKSEREMQQAQ